MKKEMRDSKSPSNKGFYIFMACCALSAIAMIALLIGGEIQGTRVAPDIEHKGEIIAALIFQFLLNGQRVKN